MKRAKLLFLVFTLVLTLALASCGGETPCTEHSDADNDGTCDVCGACTAHSDSDGNGKCDFCFTDYTEPCDEHTDADRNGECDDCGAAVPVVCETHVDPDMNAVCDDCGETIDYITVEEALELCGESGNVTTDRYYILGTVDSISNQAYGSMTVSDETGSISVYGTYSSDGSLQFSLMSSVPKKGDTVALHCILQNYKGTKEVKNARLIGFTDNSASFDESRYTASTIAEAREKEKGSLVIVEGVVAAITYSNGMHPAGVILVDETQSIYVYDVDLANTAAVGNKVKIAAEKDYWILETEQANAAKYGYGGCNQLTDAYLLANDGGNNPFDTSWIPESCVMDILETPITEDITTSLYKVTALVVKSEMPGFTNYYIDDLDGTTGTYVYTQCNGSDFAWLDPYDGKICTVYLTALNAKSTATGCNFRFVPVSVEEIENFTFADADVPAHVMKYYAAKQLAATYTGDPALELLASVSSELLGFEDALVTYSSSDTEIITFTSTDGKVIMNCPGFGTATVTVKVKYGDLEATETFTVTVKEPGAIESITVAEAIAAAKDTEVTVKGIVGASLVNKSGFYLHDASGVIAVMVSTDVFKSISVGDEVILKGKRTANDENTQIYIADGAILANFYGNHALPTDSYTTADITTVFANTDTTKVFVTTGVIEKVGTAYFTNYYIQNPDNADEKMLIYSSNGAGLAWLDAFVGKEITLELAICNWNGKGSRISVIAVITESGKVVNENNFERYGN